MRLRVALICFALLVLATSCRRTPKCNGEPERDDLYRMQQLDQEGKYPCPEHLHPNIEVHAAGVTLNGHLVVKREALPTEKPRRMDGLFNELKQNRETWKQVHPGKMFEPEVAIGIDGGLDYAVGVSALMTTAFAGYPWFQLKSGGVDVSFAYAVPGPPRPDDSEVPIVLEVTRLPASGYRAAFKQGNVLVEYSEGALDFDAVVRWIGERAGTPDAPRCREVALGMQGEFAVTATLIRRLLDLPAFSRKLPAIRFMVIT